MLDFNDTRTAFASRTDGELRNARMLFGTLKHPGLVRCGKVMAQAAQKVRFPLGWAVKPTLYKQFVGGETLSDCDRVVSALAAAGVKSTLDFSAESEQTPEGIAATFEETMRSIENAAANPNIAYAVFKPSTLTTDDLLSKASERREPLTDTERQEFELFRQRFMDLCAAACRLGVRLLVDAEDYCFQDAIDDLTDQAMRQYNTERAIVFATLQMYRHDRMPYLRRIYDDAVERGYIAGIKFVRGAYMEAERERAARMGYPDPICPSKAATDANYDAGVEFVVEHLDRMEMFMGTHNELSNLKLARLLDEKGIARNDRRVFFAQLLGMSDNISYNLAAQGYNVTKYVPYASVRDVLPYLIRRAEENTSVAGQTGRELAMLRRELDRRRAERRGRSEPKAPEN